MIIVCDRCKSNQIEKESWMFHAYDWKEIEMKGRDAKTICLCPKCHAEFKKFMIGEEKPAEEPIKGDLADNRVTCYRCKHYQDINGLTGNCKINGFLVPVDFSCSEAER